MTEGVGRHQLIDGRFVSIVPHLLEPAPRNRCRIVLFHFRTSGTILGRIDLKLVVFSGRLERAEDRARYLSAYDTFRSVWEETLRPIRGASYVHRSNDFTRQDRIQALFTNEVCAGVDCVRAIDLTNPVDLDDSWLEAWPPDLLGELAMQSPNAWINSYFTVRPEYRRTAIEGEHSISYVLGSLSVLYQIAAGVPLMLGMMRHDRSMDKLGRLWGASTLMTTTYNNVATDLVAFHADRVKAASRSFPDFIIHVFEQRDEPPT
jgi:hypothetical protein